MLKSFRISNFRNLINVEFKPVGSNVIIGPNNVGKTNLCSAIRFVSLAAQFNLEQAAQLAVEEIWNIPNVYVRYVGNPQLRFELEASLDDGGQTLDFAYTLCIDVKKGTGGLGATLQPISERLVISGGGFSQTTLFECNKGQAKLLHEEKFLKGEELHASTLSPDDATMLFRLYDLQTNRRANLFKRYVQSWRYFNLNPHMLRLPQVVSDFPIIRPDGSNMSKAMFYLHNEQPRLEKKIIEALKVIEPKIELFSYATPDPKSVYLFLEDAEQNRFGPYSMSDGTLRYLVLAFLIHTAAEVKTKAGSPGPPLVIIEQPEDGLYVGLLRSLFEEIDPTGANGQFIFTSHNPYFIDLWEKTPEGICLFKPGKPSSILVQPDPAKLKKMLEQMPLGELHFREMLA